MPISEGDSFAGRLPFPSIFPHMAGTFHYLFNHEYAHMPLRYPERLIDTCLDVLYGKRWATLGKAVLRIFAEGYLDYLDSLNPDTDDSLNDLHTLFGSVCALAEL